jgi:uncharacterized protein
MPAPAVIDGLAFARDSGRYRGEFAVAGMGRLHDLLHEPAGCIACELDGGLDERGRPQLTLRVSGTLRLVCQRCLEPMEYALALSSRLLLFSGRPPADDGDPQAPDGIEAGPAMEILRLVEDEILLGLPLSPRHAEPCRPPWPAAPGTADGTAFARVAMLKKV